MFLPSKLFPKEIFSVRAEKFDIMSHCSGLGSWACEASRGPCVAGTCWVDPWAGYRKQGGSSYQLSELCWQCLYLPAPSKTNKVDRLLMPITWVTTPTAVWSLRSCWTLIGLIKLRMKQLNSYANLIKQIKFQQKSTHITILSNCLVSSYPENFHSIGWIFSSYIYLLKKCPKGSFKSTWTLLDISKSDQEPLDSTLQDVQVVKKLANIHTQVEEFQCKISWNI